MVARMEEMPQGTIGLRASGTLSRDDYREALEPALREAVESGEVRLVFVLSDFDGLAPGAWLEDAKTGFGLGIGHHSAWRRFALVTDVEWVAKAMHMFAWMTPGEVAIFGLDELESAKSWAAAQAE